MYQLNSHLKYFSQLFIFLLFTNVLVAQSTYFQQQVNYSIDVKLDDENHFLHGNISIEYTNNSSSDLSFIYFHLWPNAYKNVNTAFAKQKLEDGSTRFFYADEDKRGYMDSLDFQIDGQRLVWQEDLEHADIAIVNLPKALKPGETTTIVTPFRVKIPSSFSRLGHVGQSYQMTQWYPKPAVYDATGWHPMPYLDMGEFYSEFGSFDVKITLPQNYVVGATGVLQTESELKYLEEKVAATNAIINDDDQLLKKQDFPPSVDEWKTIRYTADNIHDFAWFADKRFYVQKEVATLKSGKKVDAWAMFTYKEAKLWREGANYVKRAVEYYSERVGEYPYPHATAIQSALSAGAGMEYPMITVIGLSGDAKSLDQVITHEVGHNWFYGILGSNERDYPWMDEGLNSFYEDAYMTKYYGENMTLSSLGLNDGLLRLIGAYDNPLADDLGYLAYLYQKRRGAHVPVSTHSAEMTQINYGINAYIYTAYLLRYLEAYLGQEVYDKGMQAYYEKFEFKHPQPADLAAVYQEVSGKDLTWFFGDLMTTNKRLDYAIANLKSNDGKNILTLTNKGQINAPVVVHGLKDGAVVFEKWVEGFGGSKEVEVAAAEQYIIDFYYKMPEYNKNNNNFKTTGLLKKCEPFKLKLLSGIENPEKASLNFTPAFVSYNDYDGLMVGIALHNAGFPAKNFEFGLVPMYGFRTQQFTGLGNMSYSLYPQKGNIRSVKIGVDARSYHFREVPDDEDVIPLRFQKYTPSVEFLIKPNPRNKTTHVLKVEDIILLQEAGTYNNMGQFQGKVNTTRNIPRLTYNLTNKRTIDPYSIKAQLVGEGYQDPFGNQESYSRLTVEAKYKLHFKKNKKAFDIRFFTGKFLTNTNKDFGAFPLTLATHSRTDFYYDSYYFGRNRQEGLWSQQVQLGDGGDFKTPFVQTSGGGGMSNDFIFSVNLKTDLPMDLPLNLPLKPYLDFGFFNETAPAATNSTGVFINGGVMLDIGDGLLGVYVPFLANDALELTPFYTDRSFAERITFSIDLTKLNPMTFSKRELN